MIVKNNIRRLGILSLPLVALLGFSSVANATLVGSDVLISFLQFDEPDVLNTLYSETVTVVDPDPEAFVLGALLVNISSDTIRIDVLNGGELPAADFLGFTFEHLMWNHMPAEIVGFAAAATNIVGVNNSSLLFESDAVGLNLEGLTVAEGDFLEVTIDVANVAEVAEPSTLLLLLSGGLFVAYRRRRAA